ncbi:asparagine synthase-related protein [Thalassotalea agariperforans]
MPINAGSKVDMEYKVNFHGGSGQLYFLDNKFTLIGACFYRNTLLSVEQLYTLVATAIKNNTLNELLNNLSGFYSFIVFNDAQIIVATDRLRSRPIFYAHKNNELLLSDRVQWLVEQLPEHQISPASEQELMQAGYISGNNTLVEKIKQVPAGSLLCYKNSIINLNSYFKFKPKNNNDVIAPSEITNHLDIVMRQSIEQLIQYAGKRQLVIPLSGGYDSRAIATYIKSLNYSNVLTFTFGKINSQEVVISKKVAKALGFEWHFVPYDRSLWKKLASTEVFEKFILFISNYVSVPNVQVFPAIKVLFEKGIIARDAVVVPGHTGDFISGGHIPKNLLGLDAGDNEDKIVKAIIARHYRTRSNIGCDKELYQRIKSQVEAIILDFPKPCLAISVFEAWECSERQSKFIVNSNRYYDFFNLDWWMPLWDDKQITFWENVALEYRLDSKFWQTFVESKYQEVSGDRAIYGNVKDQFHPIILRVRNILDYFTDENGLYSLVPFYRWFLRKLKYPYASGTLFSYLALKVIRMQKKIIKQQDK